jgi:formylglycine-generating enzyme required for sulfatase activity
MGKNAMAVVVLMAVSLAACGKSASEPLKAEPIKDAQAEVPPDVILDAPVDVQQSDSPADGPTGKCPEGLRAPKLVQLAGKTGTAYCMDQREVTAREYEEFIAAKNGDLSGQIAGCEWNKEWMGPLWKPDAWELMPWECPSNGYDPANYPNRAVGCVDWCDARAYCAWAGKRLCGKIGGGSGDLKTMADPAQSEWANACTQGGSTKYPWGDTYTAGQCVDDTAIKQKGPAARDIANVEGSQCHGALAGFDEVYDLVGSVEEWAAECEDVGKSCAAHGHVSTVSCDAVVPPAHERSAWLGIRCCADVVAVP